MDKYYNSLAFSKMTEAQAALCKADEYFALASRDTYDLNFRKNLEAIQRKLSSEITRLINVIQDKDLSE